MDESISILWLEVRIKEFLEEILDPSLCSILIMKLLPGYQTCFVVNKSKAS